MKDTVTGDQSKEEPPEGLRTVIVPHFRSGCPRMLKFINQVIVGFRGCFSRGAAFNWFAVIVTGLMVRTDNLGVTSVIRSLNLNTSYICLLGFFRSKAWTLKGLSRRWCELVKEHAPLERHGGRVILVGDGVKQPKEGRRMPGVKRHRQESGNSGKPADMFGHLFGGVGILAGRGGKRFCIPLALRLQDGVRTLFGWVEQPERQGSHVVEMIRLACDTAKSFGGAILLLDRYFLTVPALRALAGTDPAGGVHIVTKAKSNCSAYLPAGDRTGKRGRPRLKGAAVKLSALFSSDRDAFVSAAVPLYGKTEKVSYRCVDLLWGKGLYRKLRFVLVEMGGTRSILVSTDLDLAATDIIELYGRRFSIESMFREMKQVICSFGYRFWTKAMPRLNRYRKKTEPDPVDGVVSKHRQERILLALKATEGFVFCCAVAIGLMQMLSLNFFDTGETGRLRFLRTRRRALPSEATVADFLRRNIFALLLSDRDLPITRIIAKKQSGCLDSIDFRPAA